MKIGTERRHVWRGRAATTTTKPTIAMPASAKNANPAV